MDACVKLSPLVGIPVIDADTHLAEPYDLWTSRAPAKYRDRVPQVREVDGKLNWFINGDILMGPAFPVCTILKDGTKAYGMNMVNFTWDDVFAGSGYVSARPTDRASLSQAGSRTVSSDSGGEDNGTSHSLP